jgi:hypothetical protein
MRSGPSSTKYEVRGKLGVGTNRETLLVSIWIILEGEDFPRFVTAYPGDVR